MMAEEEHSFAAIERSLKRTLAALVEAQVPFMLGGALAAWARGGPPSCSDIDVMVEREHAEAALGALVQAGMEPEKPPEDWLLKAWDPVLPGSQGDVLVDIIFHPAGFEVDSAAFARAEEMSVLSMPVHVMALEDVFVSKLLAINELHMDFQSIIQIARAVREQVDWPEVHRRTQDSPYARGWFALARELGIIDGEQVSGSGLRRLDSARAPGTRSQSRAARR